MHETVRVRRIFTFGLGRRTLTTRVLDYSLYYVGVFFISLFHVAWDAVICLTSPPMIGFIAACALSVRSVRLLHYVQDLYPELLSDNEVVRRPWVVRRLQSINRMTYQRADRIVAISEPMAKRIRSAYRMPASRVVVVRNWASGIDRFCLRANGDFTLLYSGNIGLGHGFENLELIVRRLRHTPGLRYLFVGGGRNLASVRRIYRRSSEERVIFAPYVSRELLSDVLAKGDLFLVAQKPSNVGALLPSKVYAYLAAGRPILYLGPRRSEIGELIMRHDLGLVVEDSRDAAHAAAAIKRLMARGLYWRLAGERACCHGKFPLN